MMLQRDFGQDFGDDKEMPADLHERTPGVYVRADGLHELDMLWSNNRAYQREERSPLLFFIAGLILGVITTTAVFMLIINPPRIQAGANLMTAPVSEDIESAPASENQAPGASKTTKSAGSAAVHGSMAGRTHKVANGETLGSISGKYYGSTAPQWVDKIQRANNMSTPDSLQIGQTLVIPPKNY